MKKIAIQYFGHLRTFEQCFPSQQQYLLKYYQCDLFIHTWDKLDHTAPVAYDKTAQSTQEIDASLYQKIVMLYQPKTILIQTQSSMEQLLNNEEMQLPQHQKETIYRARNMLYSMIQVNESRIKYEKTHNQHYDFIIFLRPDILLRDQFNLKKYTPEFLYSKNSIVSFINAPLMQRKNARYEITYLANDIFFFLQPYLANNIFSINSYLKYDFTHYARVHPNANFSTAILFHEYLSQLGGFPRYYNFPYSIIRNEQRLSVHLGANNMQDITYFFTIKNKNKISTKIKKYRKHLKILILLLTLSILFNIILII